MLTKLRLISFLIVFMAWGFTRAENIDSQRLCVGCSDAQLNVFFNETLTPYAGFSLINPNSNADDFSLRRSIVLFHGLSDSPYYLKDLAALFYKNGFDVIVPLLKGHGNDYAGLETLKESEAIQQANEVVRQALEKYENVSAGGFSRGGLLATRIALNPEFKTRLQALYLFSPALRLPMVSMLAGKVAGFVQSLSQIISIKVLTNIVQKFLNLKVVKDNCVGCSGAVRYDSIPLNALGQLQRSSDQVKKTLKNETIEIPTVMVLSSTDTVINTEKVKKIFIEKFAGPKHLLWIQSSDGVSSFKGLPADQMTIIHSELAVSHAGLVLKDHALAKPSETNPSFDQMQSSLNGPIGGRCKALFN